MAKIHLDFMKDRTVKRYCTFLLSYSFLLIITSILLCAGLTSLAKTMLLSHDQTIAAALISQGVPENVIAGALTSTDTMYTQESAELIQKLGIRPALDIQFLPSLLYFEKHAVFSTLVIVLPICFLLHGVSFLFFRNRENLYRNAVSVIHDYIDGCYSNHLPQTGEGGIYRMFSSVDQLATMLRAQGETEQKSKVFLRNTISDISHQLKTPLAALSMYQEIMENECDKPDVIQEFVSKTGLSLRRMEQLIQSMLKITRLDTGNIVFEKKSCLLSKLVADAVRELTARADREHKTIIFEGSATDTLPCDAAWTSEAIGNIVKNSLDHMDAGGIVRIAWEVSPLVGVIRIADNGYGIAPEDIHHIFKRFYRSCQSSDTQGIGLGLPLAKSIIDGQGGTISLQSTPHTGTTFTLTLPSNM